MADVVAEIAVVDGAEEMGGRREIRVERGEELPGETALYVIAVVQVAGDAVGDDIVGVARVEHAGGSPWDGDHAMEESEGAVGGYSEVGVTGGVEEVPEAVDRDRKVAGVGTVVFPVPSFLRLKGEGAFFLSGEGAVGDEVGADFPDPRERGEAGDLLIRGLGLETGGKLARGLAEAAVDVPGGADAGGDHLGDGKGRKSERWIALFPGIVFLEGAVAGGAAVPEAAGAGGDRVGERFRERAVRERPLGLQDRVAALLEDDRGEVTHPVVPEVSVEASEGGTVRVPAALRENAREKVGEKLAEVGGHKREERRVIREAWRRALAGCDDHVVLGQSFALGGAGESLPTEPHPVEEGAEDAFGNPADEPPGRGGAAKEEDGGDDPFDDLAGECDLCRPVSVVGRGTSEKPAHPSPEVASALLEVEHVPVHVACFRGIGLFERQESLGAHFGCDFFHFRRPRDDDGNAALARVLELRRPSVADGEVGELVAEVAREERRVGDEEGNQEIVVDLRGLEHDAGCRANLQIARPFARTPLDGCDGVVLRDLVGPEVVFEGSGGEGRSRVGTEDENNLLCSGVAAALEFAEHGRLFRRADERIALAGFEPGEGRNQRNLDVNRTGAIQHFLWCCGDDGGGFHRRRGALLCDDGAVDSSRFQEILKDARDYASRCAGKSDRRIGGVARSDLLDDAGEPVVGMAAVVFLIEPWIVYGYPRTDRIVDSIHIGAWTRAVFARDHSCLRVLCPIHTCAAAATKCRFGFVHGMIPSPFARCSEERMDTGNGPCGLLVAFV